jgi:DNA-binding NtrC family response regulator
MTMAPRILVADDKANVVDLVATILENYDVTRAADGAQAIDLVSKQKFDVVLTDVRMPGADGFEVLQAVKRSTPATQVIVMTGFATVPDAVMAVKQGAYDYIEKPFDPDDVALAVARAVEHGRHTVTQADAREKPQSEDGAPGKQTTAMPYREAVEAARDRASRDYLVALMREFGGCVTWAAERAGMERESLHRVLKRYGIHSEDFKTSTTPDA